MTYLENCCQFVIAKRKRDAERQRAALFAPTSPPGWSGFATVALIALLFNKGFQRRRY